MQAVLSAKMQIRHATTSYANEIEKAISKFDFIY